MAIPASTSVLCVTETELLQWISRGRMHLLRERVFTPEEPRDSTLFACCTNLKLDDAKARVLVVLRDPWDVPENRHPKFGLRRLMSLPLSVIYELAAVLPQHRRRIEGLSLPVAQWSAIEEWDEWLLTQGLHERRLALLDAFHHAGPSQSWPSDPIFSGLVHSAMRPPNTWDANSTVPLAWQCLFKWRDTILKLLRFHGHSDRSSFFHASIEELLRRCLVSPEIIACPRLIPKDAGWVADDINEDIAQFLSQLVGFAPNEMLRCPHPLVGALYLRVFDELFYGDQDWPKVEGLLCAAKTLLGQDQADMLIAACLASLTTEQLRSEAVIDCLRKYASTEQSHVSV